MWKLRIDTKDVYGKMEFEFETVMDAAKFIDEVMTHTCNEMEFHLVKVKKVVEELPADESEVEA